MALATGRFKWLPASPAASAVSLTTPDVGHRKSPSATDSDSQSGGDVQEYPPSVVWNKPAAYMEEASPSAQPDRELTNRTRFNAGMVETSMRDHFLPPFSVRSN